MPAIAAYPSHSGTSSRQSHGHGPPRRISARKGSYRARTADLALLGLAIVLGSHHTTWNRALAAGVLPSAVALLVVTAAYVVFVFSLTELSSVLPLAGGSHVLGRCTFGYFFGFMVGAIDVLIGLTHTADALLTIADVLAARVERLRGPEPLLWVATLVLSVLLHSRVERTVWRVTRLLGATALLGVLVFALGSLRWCNLSANGVRSMDMSTLEAQPDSLGDIVRVLPLLAWFFIGLESVSQARDQAVDPEDALPRAQRIAVLAVSGLAVAVFFVVASLPPGLRTSAQLATPFDLGFVQFLRVKASDAALLTLPAVFASAFGFTWVTARHLMTLGHSGLLPAWLGTLMQQAADSAMLRSSAVSSTSTPALTAASALSLSVAALAHYTRHRHALVEVCIGLACLSFLGQLAGFLSIRARQSGALHVPRRSPFGAAGAVVSLLLWAMTLLSVVALKREHDERTVVSVSLAVLMVALALYYFLYASVAQVFSPGERELIHALSELHKLPADSATPLQAAFARAAVVKPAPTVSSSKDGSLSMAELVRAGIAEGTIREDTDLSDDTEVPYIPNPPPPRPMLQQLQQTSGSPSGAPLRRAGSDGSLNQRPTGVDSLGSLGWGRSFLRRGRLERLKEETDRDLRSAISGIWSERSRRFSRNSNNATSQEPR
ncbi:hypothetical protein P43SY_001500 [Pythium insidiosum]|uniref:Amino acid permease/ SLC12A domain-containing protein n=1 Tax=Pythium insidiosum TaxID=114742 RepID=A0AAD5LTG5_PYTIN|nr:hypothetical protein P43SY_001500 [Pythium insidiosum]